MPSNNLVLLRGRVTSEPRVRVLPSGSSIVNIELTTQVDDAAASVPIVLEAGSVDCGPGDELVVVGHIRRRFFRAGGVTQSRTEVVAERIVPAGRSKTVDKLASSVVTGFLDR